MTEFDPYDRLVDACRNSSRYPYTLLKETTSRAVLEGYSDHLLQNDDALFDSSKQRLLLWEAWHGAQSFKETKVDQVKHLTEHLVRDGLDPNCRHVFIESANSRAPLNCSPEMLKTILTYNQVEAPLNCSPEMLKTLLTYHQVEPSFLDSLFAFGDQDEPLDAGLAHFRSDDKLSPEERWPPLARLGRSGRELRHSFLLRSVERDKGATDPWSIRQVAVYHSFDVDNGVSFWITVKGNDLLQRRIIEDSLYLPVHQGAMGSDVGPAFDASLATHLTFFRWCEQNWRWYIRDIEDRIRGALVRAKTIPVDSEPRFTRATHKTDIGISTSTRDSEMKPATFAAVSEKRSIIQSIRRLPRPRTILNFAQDPAVTQDSHFSNPRRVPEGMLVMNMFNYKEFRGLSILSELLEEAALVIQLNVAALQDVSDYYQRLVHCEELSPGVQIHMQRSISAFLPELQQIIRSLETRHSQVVSLRNRLENGKALYESLLQLRSLQVSRIFAEHGHRSAITMENIARRTERETVSMHTITVVTLLFLPATFLCTFFQSGVFQWAERQEMAGDWFFRTNVFGLFMAVCVPMTILTLCFWLMMNTLATMKARKKLSEDRTVVEAIARPKVTPV